MIKDHDRSGWFGASDTHIMLSNPNTKTFRLWWLEKLGLRHNNFTTKEMSAGTHYEHKILNFIGIILYFKIMAY